MKYLALTACCAATFVSGNAQADRGETRLSVDLTGSLSTLSEYEADADSLLYGGGFSLAQGFRNWLDAGIAAKYQRRNDVLFEGGALGIVAGDLYANVEVFDVALTARTYLELGPFLRLRPLLGLQVGGQAAHFKEPVVFVNAQQAATGENSWAFSLLGGVEAGVAYRLNDSFEAALLLSAEHSDVQTSFGLTLEVSWQRL